MGKLSIPKFDSKKLGLSPWVHFDQFNNSSGDVDGTKNGSPQVDYSPLRRVTFRSVVLGVVVSMGGFLYIQLGDSFQ
jgi:hypothetical protein